MRKFGVYSHPAEGAEAVKQGFSWPAFWFTWIWAFTKSLWGYGSALLILQVILAILLQEDEPGCSQLVTVLALGFLIWAGFKGNGWRRANLAKRGYVQIKSVEAESADAAIRSSSESLTEEDTKTAEP